MLNNLVSVVMPSYNSGDYIEMSIRSVLEQTYQNWELLIVDDCSTDDTMTKIMALKENEERISVYQNVYNRGAAVSRNIALREAKGRWIAFLDSDDLWEPTKLEKQIRFMEENGYAFSYTSYQEISDDSEQTGFIVRGPKHITKTGMYAYCWPGCLTVMYDQEKIGLVQIADLKKNNDYAMWLKIIRKADCYLLDDCLAKYRRRIGSISNQSYVSLISWHYRLFRIAEKKDPLSSMEITIMNLVCGVFKKLFYVKKCVVTK